MNEFEDWLRSPNIAGDPDTYELENEAIARDGRLDEALVAIASWAGKTLLDIGCGTGFWLPRYAERAERVLGVEPDPVLFALAAERVAAQPTIEMLAGSAEHLPVPSGSVDVAHARFAYFFGAGAEAGLVEAARVLKDDGVLLVIDNSWHGGDFAELLGQSTMGNAAFDPAETEAWWAAQGAERHEVIGGWHAESLQQLERILRIEFPSDVVDSFMKNHDSPALIYHFALYEWRPPYVSALLGSTAKAAMEFTPIEQP